MVAIEMASAISLLSPTPPSSLSFTSHSSVPSFFWVSASSSSSSHRFNSALIHSSNGLKFQISNFLKHGLIRHGSSRKLICKAAEHIFPDPIPEFADAETEKFSTHMRNKLSKRMDMYGDSLEEVVGICTEILSTFLHTEYGGPGTLLVIPFIDMADTITERGLPGAPQAARVAVKWAQNHVDKDWKEWTAATASNR